MWMELIFAVGIIALLFAGFLFTRIRKRDQGTPEMKEISGHIQRGAKSYLNRQYRVLVVFVIIVAVVLALIKVNTAIAFVAGAILSALAGNIGMRTATSANARTANACRDSLGDGLRVAFSSGAVMGMTVVGLGLLGVSALFLIFNDAGVLFGFGFGASSIALFARVGGGIYTKAADVGADLVGKVEAGIPEDDPRNPATIADNVGDNVGDVAGMGADLFESYVDSIIAALAISVVAYSTAGGVLLPMMLAGAGILASIIGYFFVRTGQDEHGLHGAMNKGIFAAAILMAVFAYFLITYVLGAGGLAVFYALLSGLAAGIVIGLVTEFYTSDRRGPTLSIARASETGPATNIITGISVGMQSTVVPVLAVCVAIGLAYSFAGLYGIAIAAVGMLSTLGITLAADTYGPVADNAAGIAEMAGMGGNIRKRAEALDAVGNTTAAIGKGFAIGSAALTALALFAVYSGTVGLRVISITEPIVMIGIFIGALLPFLFTSLTMSSVGKTAMKMVEEVRRQFREIKGLLKGKAKPDYERCVEISTSAALRQMIVPGVITIVTPILVGFFLGPAALGGLLAGSITTGFLLALFMANSGGAWDNAKKYIEAGNLGGKGSHAHKAAVVGDTVGDPFKDTSGPSLNILIKLISIIALVFASLFFI
jgi:K(+)-stimulated pyrophosphate-energized sodium pump